MTLAEEALADFLAIGAEAKLREAGRLRARAAELEAEAVPLIAAYLTRNAGSSADAAGAPLDEGAVESGI